MLENASCPGVSIKVITPSPTLTWNAPIFYVIPPTSPSAILEFLNLSNKVVFPWSTCPIIVTIGGLVIGFSLCALILYNGNIGSIISLGILVKLIVYDEN